MPKTLNAYDLFSPPLELRVHVRAISTYETSRDLVVDLDLELPAVAADIVLAGLQGFAESQECSVVVLKNNGSQLDKQIGIGFGFEDEHSALTSIAQFWDYLTVVLRLEPKPSKLSTAQAVHILNTALAGSVVSRALEGGKVYEHTFTLKK